MLPEPVLPVEKVAELPLSDRRAVALAALASAGSPKVVQPEPVAPVVEVQAGEICGLEAYNDVNGENYRCCLPPHGPKVKHGAWLKL